jgi:predicted nucleic acid-binding protein
MLDACALITILKEEEGADIVDDLLNRAMTGEIIVSMSIINFLEVFYGYVRVLGFEQAQALIEPFISSPIKIIRTISWQDFYEAARFKTSYKMSLADAIFLATASSASATAVTSDRHELEAVKQGEDMQFLWVR